MMLIPNNLQDLGLLVLRLAIGAIFIYHGSKKLNGKMGGFMLFIGICETLGGIASVVGFLTQYAGIGLAIIMLGAMCKKIFEWKVPFYAHDKAGWEIDLILLAAALVLALSGAGAYSLDAILHWWP